jgi:hypothetical protein
MSRSLERINSGRIKLFGCPTFAAVSLRLSRLIAPKVKSTKSDPSQEAAQ